MKTLKFAQNYFNITNDIKHFSYKKPNEKAIVILKIISICSIIIPIGVGIMYAVSKHKHNIRVIKKGEIILSRLKSNTYEFNQLLPSDVEKVCSAASIHFQKGHKIESRDFIMKIKGFTDKKSALILEHLNSLQIIAKTQIKTNLIEEGLETARSIFKQIHELRETSPEIIKYNSLAEMVMPHDSVFADLCLNKALNRINQYKDNLVSTYGKVGEYETYQISIWEKEVNKLKTKLKVS